MNQKGPVKEADPFLDDSFDAGIGGSEPRVSSDDEIDFEDDYIFALCMQRRTIKNGPHYISNMPNLAQSVEMEYSTVLAYLSHLRQSMFAGWKQDEIRG